MSNYPIIKKIIFNRYKFPIENMRRHTLSWIYEPGSKASCNVVAIKIATDIDPNYKHAFEKALKNSYYKILNLRTHILMSLL